MMELEQLLSELEVLGVENDAQATSRENKYLNITRDTGEFLAVLIKTAKAEAVLEIGTSNGYSTLWIASALPDNGLVTTVEVSPDKIAEARANFLSAKLTHKIDIVQDEASHYIKTADQQFDMVFLDADRSQYLGFAPEILALVRPGGLLVCDNAVSHASELEPFVEYVRASKQFTVCLVPVGKGEFLASRNS